MVKYVKNKLYVFALLIIKSFKVLSTEQREFVLSKALLRRGTAIREAHHADSNVDFIYKMSISLIEANIKKSQLSLIN